MSASDELRGLKEYLLHRTKLWLDEHPNHYAQDLAKAAGVSASHLSNILARVRPFSEPTVIKLIDFFGLTIESALADAREWRKSQPPPPERHTPIETQNMKAASEHLKLLGVTISDATREQAAKLVPPGTPDREVGWWVVQLSSLHSADKTGTLARRLAAGKRAEVATRRRRRPRRP